MAEEHGRPDPYLAADDPGRPWLAVEQFWDQENAWYRDTIRRVGWALTHVVDPDGRNPPFAYTAGLWGFDHPELIVFGLGQQPSASLLNHLGGRVRDGEVFSVGTEIALPATLPVRGLAVPNLARSSSRPIPRRMKLHRRA